MPIQRRLSYCFCLFTALALACETAGQVTRERHEGPSPPIDVNPVKPSQPGTFNLRGTPMKGRTRHTEAIFDIEAAQLTVKAGPVTVEADGNGQTQILFSGHKAQGEFGDCIGLVAAQTELARDERLAFKL